MYISYLYVQTITRQCVCFPNSQWGVTAHDRSMSKSKKADVPATYPLKGEHKKPEHLKTPPMVKQRVEEPTEQREPVGQFVSDVAELQAL